LLASEEACRSGEWLAAFDAVDLVAAEDWAHGTAFRRTCSALKRTERRFGMA